MMLRPSLLVLVVGGLLLSSCKSRQSQLQEGEASIDAIESTINSYKEDFDRYRCPILPQDSVLGDVLENIETIAEAQGCRRDDIARIAAASGAMQASMNQMDAAVTNYERASNERRQDPGFRNSTMQTFHQASSAIAAYESALRNSSCHESLASAEDFMGASATWIAAAAPFMQLAGPEGAVVGSGAFLLSSAMATLLNYLEELKDIDFDADGEEILFAESVCRYMRVRIFNDDLILSETIAEDERRGFYYNAVSRRLEAIEGVMFRDGLRRKKGLVYQWLEYAVKRGESRFEMFKDLAKDAEHVDVAINARRKFNDMQSIFAAAVEVCHYLDSRNIIGPKTHKEVYLKCFKGDRNLVQEALDFINLFDIGKSLSEAMTEINSDVSANYLEYGRVRETLRARRR